MECNAMRASKAGTEEPPEFCFAVAVCVPKNSNPLGTGLDHEYVPIGSYGHVPWRNQAACKKLDLEALRHPKRWPAPSPDYLGDRDNRFGRAWNLVWIDEMLRPNPIIHLSGAARLGDRKQ